MDEAAFAPGTPEVEIDRRTGMPVYIQDEKNDMGDLTLTNDRILFVSNKLGASGRLIGDLIGSTRSSGSPTSAAAGCRSAG